jgi:hypothetical protein
MGLVAGGSDSITVTGGSWSYFDWGFYNFYYNNYVDDNSYYTDGGGGGDAPAPDPEPAPAEGELTEDQEDAVKDGMDSLKSTLEQYKNKYGDFELKLPDGSTYKASDLINGADKVSKAFDALEGAQLAAALANGDADIGKIVGFVGGIAGGAAAGALGAGPIAVFAVGLGISWGAEAGYNAIATTIDRAVSDFLVNYNNQMQQANPDYNSLPSSIQEYIFLQQLFGNPSNGGYPDQGSESYHHYNEWRNNPHYNIP